MLDLDPFDYTAPGGYLRNALGTSDMACVKKAEAVSVMRGLPEVLDGLQHVKTLNLAAWCWTHRNLFQDVYPWAGTVRRHDVARGEVQFNWAHKIRKDVEKVFEDAAQPGSIVERPGEIYGELAFNHPFLEGNGRSLNTLFAEMARRQGVSFRWNEVNREDYLRHLTQWILYKDPAINGFMKSVMAPVEPAAAVQSRLSSVRDRSSREAHSL